MKKLYILLFISFISVKTFAQFSLAQKTISDVGVVNNATTAVLQQPDGKIISLGSVQEGSNYKIALLRFDSTGKPDAGFGNNGTDTFSIARVLPKEYSGASLRALALQADGKIIAAGTAYAASTFFGDVLVMRFNINGTVDSSFGNKGLAIININSTNGSIDDAYRLAIQSDGKIVTAGTSYDLVQHRMLFIRFNTNGSVDNSFGTNGTVLIDINHKDDEAFDISILPDGKMIAAGESFISNHSYDAVLIKLTENGALDNSFGINGISTTRIGDGGDVINKISIDANNRIIAAGTTQNASFKPTDVLVLRYKPNGIIDSLFAANGKKIINAGNLSDVANSVSIQPDNKILIGGFSQINSINNFLAIRLNVDGSFDNSFGTAGIATSSAYGQGDQSYGMILKTDGKFILGGQTNFGASKYFNLSRYKTDGSSDNSFAGNGKKITGIGSSEDAAYRMVRLPWDNSILLCGTANKYWSMIKYKPNGSLQIDSSFGVNGRVASVYTFSSNVGVDASPDVAVDSALHKIYLAGVTNNFFGQLPLTLVRFNRDGSQDTSFANKGIIHFEGNLFYGGVAVQRNHKILLAAIDQFNNDFQFVVRFNDDGTVDSTFGSDGKVTKLPFSVSSILTGNTNNHIFLGGRVYHDLSDNIGIFGLNPNGSIDSSFGANGLAEKDVPGGTAEVFFRYILTRDANGRFLVSGGVQGGNFTYQFSVTRFTKKGQPDSSFGDNGIVVTDETSGNFRDTYNMGIASFGKGRNCEVVTAGIKMNDFTEESFLVTVFYKNDGSIDSIAHTKKGYLDTTLFGDKYEGGYAVLTDESNPASTIIYVAGNASNGLTGDFMLVKFIKKNTINSPDAPGEKAASTADNFEMRISPNPAHGFLNVQYSIAYPGQIKLDLISVDGKINYNLLQQNANKGTQKMNVILPAGILPGMYFLKLTTKDGTTAKKILIE